MEHDPFPTARSLTIELTNDFTTELAVNAVICPSPMAAFASAAVSDALSEALQARTEDIKVGLRYTEDSVNYDDDQLKFIGWGGCKARGWPRAPGQTRSLEVSHGAKSCVFLERTDRAREQSSNTGVALL